MSTGDQASELTAEALLALLKEHLTIAIDRRRVQHRTGFFYYGSYEVDISFMGEKVASASLPDFKENDER